MRLFGNWGTIRVGAFKAVNFFFDWYWNGKWTIRLKYASGSLIKKIKLTNENLSNFHVEGKCEKGSLILKTSQGNATKEIDISKGYDEAVDMTEFSAGIIKLILIAEKATSINAVIKWHNK